MYDMFFLGSSQTCCPPNTPLTATLNVLESVSVACQPRFTDPCKWTVTAPPGAVIGVEITSLTLVAPSSVQTKNDAGTTVTTISGINVDSHLTAMGQSFTIEIVPSSGGMPPSGGEAITFKFIATSPANTVRLPEGQTSEKDP
ncbi:uncharacterized protein LOC117330193 [Pecten maximus]|uniref:uncharacterized protein LOC117330193 n=1 Tax=Pecten maximus TaxID=6579 RepID=UPI0014591835|nr:uncharacterized protein LOC117330193 [Pecten maximus]